MGWEPIKDIRVRAELTHKCVWCGEAIEAGTVYRYQVGLFNGDFQTNKWHPECLSAALLDQELLDDGFIPYDQSRGDIDEC